MLDDSFQLDEMTFFNISHSHSHSLYDLINTDDFSSKDISILNSINEKTDYDYNITNSIQPQNNSNIHHLSEKEGKITKSNNRKDSISRILIIKLYDHIIDQLNKDYSIFCKLNLNKDYRFSYFNNEKMKKKTISQREFSGIMGLSLKDVISNRKYYKTDESYDIELNKIDTIINRNRINQSKYSMSLTIEDRLNHKLNKSIYDSISDLINDDHFLSKANSYFLQNIQEILEYLLKKNVILYENLCFDKVNSYKHHMNTVNNMFHSQCFY